MFFKGILIPAIGIISSFWSYGTEPVTNLVSGDLSASDSGYATSFAVQGDTDFAGSLYYDESVEKGKAHPVARYLALYGKSLSEIPYLNFAVLSDESDSATVIASVSENASAILSGISSWATASVSGNDYSGLYANPLLSLTGGFLSTAENAEFGSGSFYVRSDGKYSIAEDPGYSLASDMAAIANGGTGASLVPAYNVSVPDFWPEGLSRGNRLSATVRNPNGKKYLYQFNVGLLLDPSKRLKPTEGLYFVNGVSGRSGGKVSYRTAKDSPSRIPYTFLSAYPDGNGGYSSALVKFKKDAGNVENGGRPVQDIVSAGAFGYYSDVPGTGTDNVVRGESANSVRFSSTGPSAITAAFLENVSPGEDAAIEFGNGKWKKYSADSVRYGEYSSYPATLDFSMAYLSSATQPISVLSKNDAASMKTVPYREVARNLLIGYFYKNWLGSDVSSKVGILDIPGGYRLVLLKDAGGDRVAMAGADCLASGISEISFECRKLGFPDARANSVTAYSETLRDNADTFSYYELQGADFSGAVPSAETFRLSGNVFRSEPSNFSPAKSVSARGFYSADADSYSQYLSVLGEDLSEDYAFVNPDSFEGNVLVNAGIKPKYAGVTFAASEVKGSNVLSVYGPENSKSVPGSYSDIPDWASADGCSSYSSVSKTVTYSKSCLSGTDSNRLRIDLVSGKDKAELDAMFDVVVSARGGFLPDSTFADRKMKPSEFPLYLNLSPYGTSSPYSNADFSLVSKTDGAKVSSDTVTVRNKAAVTCTPSASDGFLRDPVSTNGVDVCRDLPDNSDTSGFATFKVNLKEIAGKYLREGTVRVCYDNPDFFELQPSSFFGQAQGGGYEGNYGSGGNAMDYRYSPSKVSMDGKSWMCHELRLADIFPGTFSDNSMFFVLKAKQQSTGIPKATTIRVNKDFRYYDLPGGYVDLSKAPGQFLSSGDYRYSYSRIGKTVRNNLYMTMYSVNGQDQPLYSFGALSNDKASVIKSANAMDEYSMMRLDYKLPAWGPAIGDGFTNGRVNAYDRGIYGGLAYDESYGNPGDGQAGYAGDASFEADTRRNGYQFPAFSDTAMGRDVHPAGFSTFIDRSGGSRYLGSSFWAGPGTCTTNYYNYEWNGPNRDGEYIDSFGPNVITSKFAPYPVGNSGRAYAPVTKFQMTYALNVPVRLFAANSKADDWTYVNMLEPTFSSVAIDGNGKGVIYADLDDVKKNRVSTDPANPYALSKVQAGLSREMPMLFLDKRLEGKVDKVYIERQFLFRNGTGTTSEWCSWLPLASSKYPLLRSNLGKVLGSECGDLYSFLKYDKKQDLEGEREGTIANSHGMQGAKTVIKLRIVLKDLSQAEITAGNDPAQLLLQNGGESLFVMDVPVKYAGAFSSFVENALLSQDNPGMQFSESDKGDNALDIKKVNDVIESINNFNSAKFSFFTYGTNMEKKIYTFVDVGHLSQKYRRYDTTCCPTRGHGKCSRYGGIENVSSEYVKTADKFVDFYGVGWNAYWYNPFGWISNVLKASISGNTSWDDASLDYDQGNGSYRSMVTAIGNDTNFYGNLYGSGTEVTVSDILDGNASKKQPSACELFSNGKRYGKIVTDDPAEVMSAIGNPSYDDGKVRVVEYSGPEIIMLDATSPDGAVSVAGKWILRSRSRVTFAMNVKTVPSVSSGADDNFLAVVPREDGADGVPCGGEDPGIRVGGGVNSLHNVALLSKSVSTTFSNNILAIDGYVVTDSFSCLRKNVSVARFAKRASGIKGESELIGDTDGSKTLYDQYLKKWCSVVESPLVGATLYQSTLLEKSK